MGALNTALLQLFILLSPGFLFLLCFYAFSRLTRSYSSRGLLFDAASLIVISTCLHLTLILPYFGALSFLFGVSFVDNTIHLFSADFSDESDGAVTSFAEIWRSALSVSVYFFISCFLAGFLGFWVIRTIECADLRPRNFIHSLLDFLPQKAQDWYQDLWLSKKLGSLRSGFRERLRFFATRVSHQTFFPLIEGAGSVFEFDGSIDRGSDFLFAGVLTDISYGNRFLMYFGTVTEIVVGEYNSVKSISLREALRFLMKIKDDSAEIQSISHSRSVFDGHHIDDQVRGTIKHSVILIEGRTIKNISFQRAPRISLKRPKDEKAANKVMSL